MILLALLTRSYSVSPSSGEQICLIGSMVAVAGIAVMVVVGVDKGAGVTLATTAVGVSPSMLAGVQAQIRIIRKASKYRIK